MERTVRMKFMGTPYLIVIDSRSFTLKKTTGKDDKFPTPLGYHQSPFSMASVLIRQGFLQVKGDYTVKTFAKKMNDMWNTDVFPFLDAMHKEQKALSMEILKERTAVTQDHQKLVDLVVSGKTAEAKKLAAKIKG